MRQQERGDGEDGGEKVEAGENKAGTTTKKGGTSKNRGREKRVRGGGRHGGLTRAPGQGVCHRCAPTTGGGG